MEITSSLEEKESGLSKDSGEPLAISVKKTINIQYIQSSGSKQTWTFNEQNKSSLHLDDSVRVMKNKLLKQMKNVSYKEIYMFSKSAFTIIPSEIYKSITEDGEIINYAKIKQLCKNFGIENIPEEKTSYTLDEFQALFSSGQQSFFSITTTSNDVGENNHRYSFPIGQRFENKYNYLFSANPFELITVLQNIKQNPLFSFENSLLLNWINYSDNLSSNTSNDLFVCTAEDVLEYTENIGISSIYVLQMYFPFLYKDGIMNLADLQEKKQQLLDNYQKTITDQTWNLYKTVDLFYNIREQAVSPLNYISTGITSFKMILHADFTSVLPLDTIFKKIHATSKIPFIKYNPGFRRENIYRLYSNGVATTGTKIPALSSQEIVKLSKETGRTGQITLYIQDKYLEKTIQVYLNFNKDGKIELKTLLKYPIKPNDVFPMIHQIIKPILEELNAFLFETGYQINIPTIANNNNYQDSMKNEIMEIEQIQYMASIKITKKMDLKKYKGCLSSVFDVEEIDISLEKGARLKYNRVENYQEMDPITLLINQTYSKTREIEDIITELMNEFKLSEEQSRERIVKFFGEHALIQGKIVDNAGFPVTLKIIPSDNRLDIQIDQIKSLQYVDILFGYLDSIVRIFQEPTSSSPIEIFNTMCKKSVNYKNVDRTNIDNIVVADPKLITNIAQPILFTNGEPDTDFFTKEDEEEDVNESDFEFDEELEQEEAKSEKERSTEDSDEESIFGMDVEGGAGEQDDVDEDENLEINVEGKSLKNPNPFQDKIEKYDPVLVLKKEKGQYNPYSKTCPPAVMRQPVLLTQTEKNRIDSQHPGSYSTAVQYGSDPNTDKQFWYICPRYWSLKQNTSLSQEEVDEILKTNPQAIIPSKAKVVPKGAFIYEFNTPKEHLDEKGNYITHYPGLMKGKHPEGFSLPCCFKRIQAPEKEINTEKITKKINIYVMSANSRPLSENRFGFLPDQLQRFLKTDNNKCVEKTNVALIKQNTTCILRYGMEQADNQSFIGCIADLYTEIHSLKKKPTIVEMRKILAKSITLDMFLQYHNGSLVSIFRPDIIPKNIDPKNIKYKDSWFIKEIINSKISDEINFLKETISSYEAFIRYLLDETSFIDHTYLWDVITQPNMKIIPNGINMVILTIPKMNQVEILCPTSSYSPHMFDVSKGTWILFKDGDFYEPIYIYENKKKITVHKIFYGGTKALDSKMENLLKFIEKTMNTQCSPKNSLPKLYNYKRNLPIHEMLNILLSSDYNVYLQVMNYQSKIIGFIVSEKDSTVKFFVPCNPSTLVDNYDLILIDQVNNWNNYSTTIKELNQLYVKTQGKIKCSPKVKIIDDEKVIGILTETEQYIKISPPVDNIPDQLEEIEGVDYIEADKIIIGSVAPNNKRVRIIRNIHMESRFYRIFRAMVRELLSQYENRFYKLQIRDMLENLAYSYSQKMKKIEEIIRKIVGDSIVFKRMNDNTVEYLENEGHFIDYIRCKKCETRNICKVGEDGHCHLYLPSQNLVMGMSNDELYYARLSDELLRFHRIRLFMLEPMYYLNLTNIDYKINDDEILLLETFIKSDNFSDLRIFNFSEYLKQIPYDIAVPS
jgi:hypothetical protein